MDEVAETASSILINAGLVAGLVEGVKRSLGPKFNAQRFGVLLALVVGVVTALVGVALSWYEADYGPAVLVGLVAGLTAGGIYNGQQQARSSGSSGSSWG